MWAQNSKEAETMALNPWNAPQMPGGGANGWQRGPTSQMGGPGGPMGRGGAPGRDGPPFGWPPHGHPQAMPPQWAAAPHPVHQQAPWQQPAQINPIPQQHWQGPIDQKNMRVMKMQPQQQPQQWGAHKVDQGTPWESVAGGAAGQGGKEWQGGGGNAPWQAPPVSANAQPQPWQSPEWQQGGQPAPSRGGEPVAVGQWQPAQGAGAAPPLMAMQPQQWGQPPPMGAAAPQHLPAHNNVDSARQPQERGMENPGQFGPWVAPYPTDVNNDMMWHDPNPKQKRMQRDIGTQIWGDPSMQAQDIRRWKEHADDEIKPSGSDYNAGWGELPGDRWGHGWTDDHEPTEPFQGREPPFRPQQLEQLTQQISEKLQYAVRKGYVRVDLLERQLSQEKIALLNQLLQKVPKLEQAQQELEQYRRAGPTNVAAKNEADRLSGEIEQLRLDMSMIQSKIAEQSPQRVPAAAPGGAGSRLQQWRKTTTDDAKALGDLGLGGLNINDRQNPDWSTGAGAEWMPGELGNDMLKDDDGSVDGPREFVPGKKWEWRDPNKVAEDPNATPGLFGGPSLGGMFTTWAGGVEGNTWSSSPAADWVAVQLSPNVGEKTIHTAAQQVGTLAQALVARQIAYLRFHDMPAAQAQAKMMKLITFASIWVVSDAELPPDVIQQAQGQMGGWSEGSK